VKRKPFRKKERQKILRKANNKHQPKTTTETLNYRKKKQQPTKMVIMLKSKNAS